jgi:hypothetical protein
VPVERRISEGKLEAPPGFEPGVEVLQTSALPLGDGASVGEWLTRKCLRNRSFCDTRRSQLLIDVNAGSASRATSRNRYGSKS